MGFSKDAPDPDEWGPLSEPVRSRGLFGILADPRMYGSLLYMGLSLVTGIAYFVLAVVGLSFASALMPVLVGIPLLILFAWSVRLVGLIEGRLVEGLLGIPMPGSRVTKYDAYGRPLTRWTIWSALIDLRTWSTLAYFFLMLPLGILYFTVVVAGYAVFIGNTASTSIVLASELGFGPIELAPHGPVHLAGFENQSSALAVLAGLAFLGATGVLCMCYVVRGLGLMHGRLARAMLVRG